MIRLAAYVLLGIALCSPLRSQDAAPQKTFIDSDTLEMQGTDERNFFYFRGNVRVTGENLSLTCDELVVTVGRAGDTAATMGEMGAIERIVAAGDVNIVQAGRQARAGRAEVDPRAGTVTLSENPRILHDEVEVESYQFVFHAEDRRVETIPDPNAPPDKPSRSRVTLSTLPPITFSQPEEEIRVLDRLPAPPADAIDEADDEAGEEAESDAPRETSPGTSNGGGEQ